MYRGDSMAKKISVIVHMPTTEEGKRELARKVAEGLVGGIFNTINRAPAEYREELYNSVVDSVKKGTF